MANASHSANGEMSSRSCAAPPLGRALAAKARQAAPIAAANTAMLSKALNSDTVAVLIRAPFRNQGGRRGAVRPGRRCRQVMRCYPWRRRRLTAVARRWWASLSMTDSAPGAFSGMADSYVDTTPQALRLLSLAALQPGERVLDAGCGPGTVTALAARAVGPAGHVIGIDVAEDMGAAAPTRLARAR